MRFSLIAVGALVACTSTDPGTGELNSSEWTWARWSGALLRGAAPADLPPIPSTGWTRRDGPSWFREGGQVADYNADGRIDYIRIVDPPLSFNHRVWVDRDYDGYFDDYPGAADRGEIDPDYRVPRFAPADKPASPDRPPAG